MDLVEAVAGALAELRQSLRKSGTVTAVSGSRVQVTVEGGQMWLPYYDHYVPTNGDVVTIDSSLPGAWIVLGKPKS